MSWLEQMSKTEREAFIAFINELIGRSAFRYQTIKTMRLQQVCVPLIQYGGQIPENMNFAALVENCGSNIGQIRIELLQLYSEFQTYRKLPASLESRRLLSSQEAAKLTGLSPQQIGELARANKIKGAVKKGRQWRFPKSSLLFWSQ